MSNDNSLVHLLAGGAGGTAGAVITCPLEVVKTRLQSSVATFENKQARRLPETKLVSKQSSGDYKQTVSKQSRCKYAQTIKYSTCCTTVRTPCIVSKPPSASPGLWSCLKYIFQNEGPRGLFKGLGPNLVGVAPSRAIYFCAYAQAKSTLNNMGTVFTPDTPQVHMCSAAFAGFSASTLTNPIWFIKTRLQLDQTKEAKLTVWGCIKDTFNKHGIRGFYRGITASYYGIAETATHFVIYEHIKAFLRERKQRNGHDEDSQGTVDFLEYMVAGAISKTTATILAYPHEVARTRLRQEGDIYKRFWQTLRLVYKEEGVNGLYRGLGTQLVRQIPNTAIMMSTYEAVVYICTRHFIDNGEESHDY